MKLNMPTSNFNSTLTTIPLKTGDVITNIVCHTLPPVEGPDSSDHAKSVAFDAFIYKLRQQEQRHHPSTIAGALLQGLPPGLDGRRAESDATDAATACIHRATFSTTNLTLLFYANSSGQRVQLEHNAEHRTPNIEWLTVRCVIPGGTSLDPSLPADLPVRHVQFALRLPQSEYNFNPPQAPPAHVRLPIDEPAPYNPPAPDPTTPLRNLFHAVATPLSRTLNRWAAQLAAELNGPAPPQLPLNAEPPNNDDPLFPPAIDIPPNNLFPDIGHRYSTYIGPVNPLISQATFASVFPPTTTPQVHYTQPHLGSISLHDNPGESPLLDHTDKVRLLFLYSKLRTSCVGTKTTSSSDAIEATVTALRDIPSVDPTASPSATGAPTTPAGLCHRFEALIPNLPAASCHEWGINLPNEYLNKLEPDVRNAIRRDEMYRFGLVPGGIFHAATMTTKAHQVAALDALRTIATGHHETFEATQAMMNRCLLSYSAGRSKRPGSNHLALDNAASEPPADHPPTSHPSYQLSTSSAEDVISRYSGQPPGNRFPSPGAPPRPHVPTIAAYSALDNHGLPALLDPNTHFHACLGCYNTRPTTNHMFYDGQCDLYHDPIAKDRMRQNINHRRELGIILPRGDPRSRPGPRSSPTSYRGPTSHYGPSTGQPSTPLAYVNTAQSRGSALGLDTRPAWLVASQAAPGKSDSPPHKRIKSGDAGPLIGSLTVRVNSLSLNSPTRLLPAPIDNGLPHCRVSLTSADCSEKAQLACLYDTGSSMTVGWTPFHLWFFLHHPTYVHSFELFNDENPFTPLKLHGAIADPAHYTSDLHGSLNAVIRYFVRPQPTSSSPHLITIALGSDVQVNSILGWPTAQTFGLNLLVSQDLFESTILQQRSPVHRQNTKRDIPDGSPAPDPHETFASPRFLELRAALPAHTPLEASDHQQNGYLRRTIAPSS